ncbi:MAG TPA: RecQ family zinc-binding domain-containing protein [Candidatus Limnocylindrales bacterium]|nr:RecQ family zinc-binding domain-containing protein [Candidatus Limnocylindrales bacterium]
MSAQERRRLVERSRVEMIRGYAEAPGCRRAFLLGYFGEPFDPPCGRCDRCRAVASPGRAAPAAQPYLPSPFAAGDRVRHATFGAGVVTALEPDRLTVAFDDVGYRTLAAGTAEDGRLVREADDGTVAEGAADVVP